MFPNEQEHNDNPECGACGGNHGDLMGPFSEWMVGYTGGQATLAQFLSIFRSLILNMRVNLTTAEINALFASQVVAVEEALLTTNYAVRDIHTGEDQRLVTAEEYIEIDKLANTLGDTIPDWVLDEGETP